MRAKGPESYQPGPTAQAARLRHFRRAESPSHRSGLGWNNSTAQIGLSSCRIPSPPMINESHEFHKSPEPPVPEPFVLIRAIRGSIFRHHRIGPLPLRSGKARKMSGLMSLGERMGRPDRACGIDASITWAVGPGWYGARRWRCGPGWAGAKRSGHLSLEAGGKERGFSYPRRSESRHRRDAKWSGLPSHEGQRPGIIPAWANGPGYPIESFQKG
jgi:hypothetical protein